MPTPWTSSCQIQMLAQTLKTPQHDWPGCSASVQRLQHLNLQTSNGREQHPGVGLMPPGTEGSRRQARPWLPSRWRTGP